MGRGCTARAQGAAPPTGGPAVARSPHNSVLPSHAKLPETCATASSKVYCIAPSHETLMKRTHSDVEYSGIPGLGEMPGECVSTGLGLGDGDADGNGEAKGEGEGEGEGEGDGELFVAFPRVRNLSAYWSSSPGACHRVPYRPSNESSTVGARGSSNAVEQNARRPAQRTTTANTPASRNIWCRAGAMETLEEGAVGQHGLEAKALVALAEQVERAGS